MSKEQEFAFNFINDKGDKQSFPVSKMDDLQKSYFVRLSNKIKEKNKLQLELDDASILEHLFTEKLKTSLGIGHDDKDKTTTA